MSSFAQRFSSISGLILLNMTLFLSNQSMGQPITDNTFGKGVKTIARDSSFYMKFSVRTQARADARIRDVEEGIYQHRAWIRRARIKFDGFVVSPRVVYKMEFDVVGGYVRDAWIRWNFYKNLTIKFGQGKLPGNRERVVSSQKLQFVDRSQLNRAFNIDRDNGFELGHHFKIGNVFFKEALAVSNGRGIVTIEENIERRYHEGRSYTARVEMLPFGKFTKKGDLYYADLQREKTPKLMIGAVYNLNDNATKTRGQLGIDIDANEDLSAYFLDMMFKYRGIGATAEYHNKSVLDGSPVVLDSAGAFVSSYYTGWGYNTQLSYLFKNNWEIAGRYTYVEPEEVTQRTIITEYTLGVSKYVVGHSLKVQSDLTYQEAENFLGNIRESYTLRFQIEVAF